MRPVTGRGASVANGALNNSGNSTYTGGPGSLNPLTGEPLNSWHWWWMA